MAKFRMIYTEFWNDSRVVEEFTPEDKYFFLYLLTNPKTTQIGIYEITKKQMAFDIGYSRESVNALLDRFINNHKLIKYNDKTRELAIKNWGKYNLRRGGKPILDCVASELKEVKDKELIKYVAGSIEKPEIKALYDTYNDTCTTRGQEEEKEEEEYKEKEEEQEQEQEGNSSSSFLNKKSNNDFKEIAQLYQQIIGQPNGLTADWVQDMLKEYGFVWTQNAMLEAEKRGKRNKKYIEGILQNWKTSGGMKLGGGFNGTNRTGDEREQSDKRGPSEESLRLERIAKEKGLIDPDGRVEIEEIDF